MKKYHDSHIPKISFKEGQLVLAYDARQEIFPGKLTQLWHGPYRIKTLKGNKAILEEMDGTPWEDKININKLKPYYC